MFSGCVTIAAPSLSSVTIVNLNLDEGIRHSHCHSGLFLLVCAQRPSSQERAGHPWEGGEDL